MIQILWVYDVPIAANELERLRICLNRTYLGRRVRRSSVLFGRHSWVRASDPGLLVNHPDRLHCEQLKSWADRLRDNCIDPEKGPGWQLDYTAMSCGGSALLLTAPHCLVDIKSTLLAITDAVNGVSRIADLPAAPAGLQWRLWRHDLRVAFSVLVDLAQSLPVLLQSFLSAKPLSLALDRPSASAPAGTPKDSHPVDVPLLFMTIPREEWRRLFQSLDGNSSTLLAAITSRLALSVGRTDPSGALSMVFPVSTRVAGDTRANALQALRFSYTPESPRASLKSLYQRLRSELRTMLRQEKQDQALLSLTPFIPRAAVRWIESWIQGCASTITINNFNEISESVCMPTGTRSRHVLIRSVEKLTSKELIRSGGLLYSETWSVDEQQYLMFRAWQSGVIESQQDLADAIKAVISEFSLTMEFVP